MKRKKKLGSSRKSGGSMKRSGKAGSSSQSVPDNDTTDDKGLDDSLQLMWAASAYAAAHPPGLLVPGVWTDGNEKEFLKKAKLVYRESYNPIRKRGPQPKESFAINLLAHFSRNRTRKRRQQLTRNEMTKLLMNCNLLKAEMLSRNTAEKYVRLFCLAQHDVASFSQRDQQWLSKKFGSESLSPEWWRERMLGPWASEGLRRSGMSEEIRKIFEEYTPTELHQLRDKFDAVRDDHHKQLAAERERRGSRKVQDGLAEISEFDKKFNEYVLNGSP